MNFRKLGVAAAVAAALGGGLVGQANAGALAESLLNVTGFTITDGTGTALDVSAFVPGSLSFTDQLTNTSNLQGYAPGFGFQVATGFQAAVDAPQACSGPGCGAAPATENNFTYTPPPPGSLYTRGDSLLSDVPISGTGFPVGADASSIAVSSLPDSYSGVGGSTAAITLGASFNFTLAQPASSIGIMFSAEKWLQAWTSVGSVTPTFAQADMHWSLSLTGPGGVELIRWNPNGVIDSGTANAIGLREVSDTCNLNQTVSASPNSPNPPIGCNIGNTGFEQAFSTVALAANTPYSFNVSHSVQSQARNLTVPEPTTLALLGLGLLGVGFARRKSA